MSRHLSPRFGRFAAILVLIGFAGLFPASLSLAHEVRPAYLDLKEDTPGSFDVLFKTPMRGDARLGLDVVFSGPVKMATPIISRMTDNAMVQTWRISAIEPLAGQMVRIDGLTNTMTDALVRIQFIDGGEWVGRLTPGAPQATIPARQDGWAVAATYLQLGVEHIILGIDHLLFVLGLILIAPSTRQLIKAITAFTARAQHHARGGDARFCPCAAATDRGGDRTVDRVRGRRDRSRPRGQGRYRRPRALARGLCLWSAARLRLRRRAERDRHARRSHPVALLFFNLGVEVGQLLFVAVVIAIAALSRLARHPLPRWAPFAAALSDRQRSPCSG